MKCLKHSQHWYAEKYMWPACKSGALNLADIQHSKQRMELLCWQEICYHASAEETVPYVEKNACHNVASTAVPETACS